jgi:DNA polymerase-3 subunit epsilon
VIASLWPFGRPRPALPAPVAQAVERWRGLPEFDRGRPAGSGRWVVVDVETSGLDAARDSLISVGALAVVDGAIDLGESFEVVLRQEKASTDENIEVHGIGAAEQAGGEDPREALAAFLAFVGKDPLAAFHAPFDATMLRRAVERHLGVAFARPWIDLAEVAPLVWPKYASRLSGLDDWLEALSIPVVHRHRAIGDCLATAQLLLMVLPAARSIGAPTDGELLAVADAHRRPPSGRARAD